MKRLATFAAALAVAVAGPVLPSQMALAATNTTLAPDESPAALLAASVAVAEAREDAAAVAARKMPLKPGAYWWAADAPSEGEIEVVVSLEDQKAYVYRAGQLIGLSTVSTGKEGKETPPGIFPILEKKRSHFSRTYDNAPMPFMHRLDRWGIALHGGVVPGYRASRGCVRLPQAFAAKLFAMTQVGDRVVIG